MMIWGSIYTIDDYHIIGTPPFMLLFYHLQGVVARQGGAVVPQFVNAKLVNVTSTTMISGRYIYTHYGL